MVRFSFQFVLPLGQDLSAFRLAINLSRAKIYPNVRMLMTSTKTKEETAIGQTAWNNKGRNVRIQTFRISWIKNWLKVKINLSSLK